MNRLTCEMCGSTDLVKQDGVFVCQACGTKYSVEEAKKMMIEGNVDVSGSTIKVDPSAEIDNLYQLARRAKETDNNKNAQKYYEMLLVKEPTSWEANFYSIFYKAMSCTIGEISAEAENVGNCIKETFRLIHDNVSDGGMRTEAVTEVKDQSYKISKLFFDVTQSKLNDMDPILKKQWANQYLINSIAASNIQVKVCDSLCEIFSDDDDVMRGIGVSILKERIEEKINKDYANRYLKVISKYDSTYQLPASYDESNEVNVAQSPSPSGSNGCYVATAVYGSYDCPQVWTLRRFRDSILAETWYGRFFIRTYYLISPTFVKWFGQTEWFKKMWKSKLDRIVEKLQSEGIESTPYKDREW